jgi:hypothetical protein
VSANLDLVRSLCVAWEEGDYSSTEWADPEIEFVVADGLSAIADDSRSRSLYSLK